MGTGAIGVGMLYQLSSIIPTESESDAGMPTLTQNSFLALTWLLMMKYSCYNTGETVPMFPYLCQGRSNKVKDKD